MPRAGANLVLDLTRLLPGPLAGRMLAALGFEVLRLRPPGGDLLSELAPAAHAWLEAGKRVETLDLKTPAGAARLRELAADAAILLENSLPGRMEAWGVGPDELCRIHPELVYVRLAGQRAAATRELPGHDLTYLAAAGLLPHFDPAWKHVQLADLCGAFWMALAAQQGLLAGGGFYEVYLEEAATAAAYPALPGLDGSRCGYTVYPAAAGSVALAALEPHLWERFCGAAGQPGWRGLAEAPATVGEAGFDAIAAFFRSRPAEAWESWGREHRLPLRALALRARECSAPPWASPPAPPAGTGPRR